MAQKQNPQTGPKSNAGKVSAAKNSTDHGLRGTAEDLLPGETEADRAAIQQHWEGAYDMTFPGVAALLEHHVVNDRLLRQANRQLVKAESKLAAALNADASHDEIVPLEKRLTLILRYKTTHERSFQRSLRNLEQFGARRVKEGIAERSLMVKECCGAVSLAIKCSKNDINMRQVYRDLYEQGGDHKDETTEPSNNEGGTLPI